MDSCRIWESHPDTVVVGSVRQDQDDSQSMPQATVFDKSHPATFGSARLHQDVERVMPTARGPHPSSADRERSHTERSGSTPDHYSPTFAGKGVGIYVAGHASGLISHGRKDISAGTSTSRGSNPTNERSVETWPMRTAWSWSEPMFTDGRILPLSTAGMVCGCAEWTIPGFTDAQRWMGLSAGKRGMVRAGGSASLTTKDSDAPDPVGGEAISWGKPSG